MSCWLERAGGGGGLRQQRGPEAPPVLLLTPCLPPAHPDHLGAPLRAGPLRSPSPHACPPPGPMPAVGPPSSQAAALRLLPPHPCRSGAARRPGPLFPRPPREPPDSPGSLPGSCGRGLRTAPPRRPPGSCRTLGAASAPAGCGRWRSRGRTAAPCSTRRSPPSSSTTSPTARWEGGGTGGGGQSGPGVPPGRCGDGEGKGDKWEGRRGGPAAGRRRVCWGGVSRSDPPAPRSQPRPLASPCGAGPAPSRGWGTPERLPPALLQPPVRGGGCGGGGSRAGG